MPTIKEKMIFNYDGVWSDFYGLININLDNAMFDETLVASRSIIESQNKGNEKPMFQGFIEEPIEFDMTIAFTDKFDDKKIYEIIDWLFQGYYRPLYFLGGESRVFYCTPVGDSRIIHNGLNEGYFTITMRCNSSYVFSPIIFSDRLDLSDGVSKTIEIINDGYGYLYPEISIQKIGVGSVSIQNLSDGGKIWEIRNLNDRENVYIDCKKEIIKSDSEDIGVYHYTDTSGEMPRLMKGRNLLMINGRCIVQFRYQFKYRY